MKDGETAMKMDAAVAEKRLYDILRIGLGLLFIYASAEKIYNPVGFADVIANYHILPTQFINPAALLMPWVEFLCGVLLVAGVFVKGSAMIVNVLMAVFIAAFFASLYRGLDISCGCFSLDTSTKHKIWVYIVRDFAILAAGAWVFWYGFRSEQVMARHISGK